MKSFLKKIVLFALLLLCATSVYLFTVITFNHSACSATKNWQDRNGKSLNGYSYYVFGNSHPECAINDTISTLHLSNMANSGEPLFFSVPKMRRIAKENPNSIFIVELGNHSLHAIHWVLDDEHLHKNYRQYFYHLTKEEHQFIFRNNPSKALKTLLSLSPQGANTVLEGGYNPLHKNLADYYKARESNEDIVESNTPNATYSDELQYQNIASLISFMRDFPHIRVIAIRCPVHSSVQEQNEKEYMQFIEQITHQYPLQYLDFKDSLYADTYYADPEHLNVKGATVFTKKLEQALFVE
jgi:hypothetical protein